MSRLTVFYQGRERNLEAADGKTLLSILQQAQIPISAPCAGQGKWRSLC